MKRIMNTGSGVAVTWLFAAIILLLWAPSTLQAQADLSDMEIVDAIQDEMQYDPAIWPSTLDITASEGIITLDGRVTNLLAKERAERITETVKGVRSVINLITVSPPIPRSDQTIRKDVEDALLADPATESYEVTASVDNGVVTLTGSVDSWHEKELAGNVAKGVRGVVELENDLDVDLSLIRVDEEIERKVEEVLRWDVLVDGALIEAEADNGRLNLKGVVGSAAEKRREW